MKQLLELYTNNIQAINQAFEATADTIATSFKLFFVIQVAIAGIPLIKQLNTDRLTSLLSIHADKSTELVQLTLVIIDRLR